MTRRVEAGGNNGEAVPQTQWQRERQRGTILPMLEPHKPSLWCRLWRKL